MSEFYELDTVAYCGPILRGELAHSVNFADARLGGVVTRALRNYGISGVRRFR